MSSKSINKLGGKKKKSKGKKKKKKEEGLRVSITSLTKDDLKISVTFMEDSERRPVLFEESLELAPSEKRGVDVAYESLGDSSKLVVEIAAKAVGSDEEPKKRKNCGLILVDVLYIDEAGKREFPIMMIGVIQGMVNAEIIRV